MENYQPINNQCPHHIETSQLICSANIFIWWGTLGVNELNENLEECWGPCRIPVMTCFSRLKYTSGIIIKKLYFLQMLKLKKQPPEMFYKEAVVKNFAIFAGKHLCWSLFLIMLQTFRPASLLKINSNTILLKNTCFEEHLRTTASEVCFPHDIFYI